MNAIIISALWGIIMMFSGIVTSKGSALRNAAVLGLLLLLTGNYLDLIGYHFFPVDVHKMLFFDSFGLLANTIIFGATLIYVLLSGREIENIAARMPVAECFALIFFVLCGVSLVTTFNTLLMLFIGIEIISIPLYILTGSDKRNLKSNEAALKYFLMGSFSTGLMLLGIALLYGASATGTFSIDDLGVGKANLSALYISGLLLLLVAMGFKVSAAPFHFWTPDVYDGAPTVFTSFMATIVKAGIFIGFIRLFDETFSDSQARWQLFVAIITAVTLFIGNITAVFQQSVKRMLAYSSIAQAGFMLLALLSINGLAKEGILLYAAAYSLATIGIFAVLIKMKDYTFEGFNGLAKHHPVLAATCTIFLLSLAGIPLTAGFFAKYYMLAAVIETGHFLWLVIFAVLCAAVSVYYYFRVIQAMYFKDGDAQALELRPGFKGLLVVVAALILLLGVFPQVVLDRLHGLVYTW
ncbi:NADH-quinone oxidoreductase subunit N [Flavitalea sp. BT771]|uniref:NADH-quinone oxidoreductase subunit N n=1 Tax=Flavitalea sp. BT771 TaxID=3063329 RepID=UPI0026E14626|nr:NADH-quinone oxidoreductase subunit N [Flavitalea sp. BT771]MDO6433243.1 NADH-quinone oxidoreductase subunit N [Flavitalea sp. BT771]MDV6221481.1 NADH-quinone oxidoreductase subunit N [Flavitalea sp. BT771]